MRESEKTRLLLEHIEELKEAGFKVYGPEPLTTYCFAVKNDKIAYVERSDWGFRYSTVHKPSRYNGTGFGFGQDISPSVDAAEACLTYHMPGEGPVKKYRNWDDYAAAAENRWQEYVEL